MKAKKYSKKGPQILLVGDLDFFTKSELGGLKKDIPETEKNVNSGDRIFRKETLEPQ